MSRHTPRDEDHIRTALRDAAEAYEPDRGAISTRVAQGRAADREAKSLRRSLLSLRPVAAAFAVVGVLVASGIAFRAGTTDDQNLAEPPPPAAVPAPVSAGPATSRVPAETPGTRKPTGGTGTTGSPDSPGTPAPTQPAGTTGPPGAPPPATTPPAGASWLNVTGGTGKDSVAKWTEKNVTLRNTSPIVALTVTITVPMSDDLTAAGKFTTVPNSDLTMTVAPTPQGLTYSFVLRDGVKLTPGNYTFAAQFTHKSGREATRDFYDVQAASPSATAERTGAFT